MDSRPSDPVIEADRRPSVVRRAVLRFAAWSLVILLLLTAGTFVVSKQIAEEEALRDAESMASIVAATLAAPLVDAAVRRREPGAALNLDTALRTRMSDGSIRHIKIWSTDGVVIWADEPDLVGRSFDISEQLLAMDASGGVIAELSELEKEENQEERDEGPLVEVYVATADSDGTPLVFEGYFSADRIEEDAQVILFGMMPLVLGALVLFQLATVPIAVSLARRVDASRVERTKLMRHAILASELERRRIARDIHDGVLQDLAGVGYVLPSIESQLDTTPDSSRARALVQRVASMIAHDVTELRSLVTDIYPPDLRTTDLVTAIEDLARSAGDQGVEVDVRAGGELDLSTDVARIAYRVVREGLRNVVKHAQAGRATVEVSRAGTHLHVSVEDDGVGIGDRTAPTGHLGLRLLEDTIRDCHGRLTVGPGQGGGTRVEAQIPLALVEV